MDSPRSELENWYVLCMVQALYGGISPNLRAVTLDQATPEAATFHFLLAEESAEDRVEIDDALFEFQALQARPVDCRSVVTVGQGFEPFRALPGRGIYHRKEGD